MEIAGSIRRLPISLSGLSVPVRNRDYNGVGCGFAGGIRNRAA